MVFEFRNIGIVESANIELKGLTVITGLNDTGKSFISKFLYGVIKTIKDSNTQESNLRSNSLDSAWVGIRLQLNNAKKPDVSSIFERTILPLRNEVLNDLLNKIPTEVTENKIRAKQLEFAQMADVSPDILNKIRALFETIIMIVKANKGEEDIRLGYFNQVVIQQLFRSQINSLSGHESLLSFKWTEGESEVMSMTTQNNKANTFKVNNSLSNFLSLQDATVIDSPIIVQLQNLILKYRLEVQRNQDLAMPIYYTDLVNKFIPLGNPIANDISNNIQETIQGKVVYDDKLNKIVYQKHNGHQIDGFNIANGIKAFGVIQLLLNSGAIHKNSLLIIDEPEVHLHPQWEIKFAEVIVNLAKANIPVLISSHSPYLIEAIEKYSRLYSINDKVKYYFGCKNNDGQSSFKDVTNDLNPIFKALAEPMKSLNKLLD